MKHWILAATALLLMQGVEAREHWGPPPACPQPKVDCCPKPKCPPAKTCEKPCAPKEKKSCKPECSKPACPKPCEPCCPPVCFERGFPTTACCTPSAYSEPAAFDMRCGAQVYITANFIYWEAFQDGMDLAVPAVGTTVGDEITIGTVIPSPLGQSILQQNTDYKPGFQVGLGWEGIKDNWALYAQYTWLHGSTSTSKSASNPDVDSIDGVSVPQTGLWAPASWLEGVYVNEATTHLSSKWKYKIDIVDAQISRPFYSGQRYTVEPFFGLRGAWIRQHLDLTSTNVATSEVAISQPTRDADYSSRSSAVGPRIGINGNWHLGYGLRFLGNAAASILFTGYDVHGKQESPDATGFLLPVKLKYSDYNVLRPNFDLSLGLGWGSYLSCRRFHFDLSATYDFNVFWGQNMMRQLADLTLIFVDGAPGDLYLHGLTIQTRFDF